MSNYRKLLDEFRVSKSPPTQEAIDIMLAKSTTYTATHPQKETRTKRVATLAQRVKRLNAKKQRRMTKLGMSYTQWEEHARKYYTIDPVTFLVTSIARSPNCPPETWECIDMIDAENKVIQLMDYKYNDHFVRTDRPLSDFAW